MRIKLKERRTEAPDVMTFVFDLDEEPFPYAAGQFAFFELDALSADDPRGKRRHFTLSSSPTEHGIVQFTTKLRGFGLKETLRTAPIGLEVVMEEARGRFTLPEIAAQPIAFIGGGVGVTPFRSMLRYVSDEILPYQITLLYSATTPDQIVYRREFESLPQENPNVQIILTVTDANGDETGQGETGRIDAEKISKSVRDIPHTLFYTCGPPPMVQAMEELLKSMNVAPSQIRVERFSGYV